MPLVLVSPYRKLITGPTEVVGSVFRLVALSAPRGAIGVHEFELYDSTNQNLCRTPGFIPSVVGAPGGGDYVTYPPTKTIDGDITNWPSTTYLNSNGDGSMYLEYTFPKNINPTRWRMMCEGTWVADNAGVKLLMLRAGKWVDITGTTFDGPTWAANTWKQFLVPAKV